MKHRIRWLQEQIDIHISMNVSELFVIVILLAGLVSIITILVAQAIHPIP